MTQRLIINAEDDMRNLVIIHIETAIPADYDFIGWEAHDTFTTQFPDATTIDFEGTPEAQLAMFRAVLPNLTNAQLLSCLDTIACHAYR